MKPVSEFCKHSFHRSEEGARLLPWKLKALLGVNVLRPQWAEALVRRAVGKQSRD